MDLVKENRFQAIPLGHERVQVSRNAEINHKEWSRPFVENRTELAFAQHSDPSPAGADDHIRRRQGLSCAARRERVYAEHLAEGFCFFSVPRPYPGELNANRVDSGFMEERVSSS